MKLHIKDGKSTVPRFHFLTHWAEGQSGMGSWKFTNKTFLPEDLHGQYDQEIREVKETVGMDGFLRLPDALRWADTFADHNDDRTFRVMSCDVEYTMTQVKELPPRV